MNDCEKRKTILFLDDMESVSKAILEYFESFDIEFYYPLTFVDMDYFVDEDPGIAKFDHIIMDLDIPCEDDYFTKEEKQFMNEQKFFNINGWIWLRRLWKRYPEIRKKTIVLSAYIDNVPEYEKVLYGKGVVFIDKNEGIKAIEKLQELLQ